MRIRPRSSITETFSTFAYFDDNDVKWITDNKLRRSIEKVTANSPPQSKHFWSLHWYRIWQESSNDLAFRHLLAYLQEPCYWAVKKVMEKYSSVFSSTQHEFSDYFQMSIAEANKICNGFNPQKSSNLEAYAAIAFPSLLKDILRRRRDADICTNHALLRKVTRKRFVEALNTAGLTSEQIVRYKLAWRCFQTLYVQTQSGGMGALPEPSLELWSQIANLYNQERQSQLVSPGRELDGDTIQQWLNQAAMRIRSYLYPRFDSLDVPIIGSDSSVIEDLPDESLSECLIIRLITEEDIQERQSQTNNMHNFMLGALKKLAPDMREILHMCYKQDLTQQEIARRLDKQQVWVSRRLKKTREILLTELTLGERELQKGLGVNVFLDPNQLNDKSVALEEWLRVSDWSEPKLLSTRIELP